ncbi:PREDICTED: uncharacterized protein LOC105570690 isoform X1 [Vollenhovia emeryi]|uniref:uncharacterized protein LOC105570690 isoform X1 n=1 Tax=Vollenhovia emeryi TaxID=411798 RepID=UPI0005F49ACC|nr:PREDICTED: uncharacterized protein LOC105570690 isoform X1 [Vollenhovia emeryi]XP_011883511.1 PREDICTED: uncharacterized protein LOC105570690 isoform X1 [Vollenhovia emeryi]
MHKCFFERRITHYNRQWYCCLCETTLQNFKEAQHHSENAHSTIDTQTSYFLNKFDTLTIKNCKILIYHGIVIRDIQQDLYFCVHCQCLISTLHNCYQHLKKKAHQKYMSTISKHSTNEQQNLQHTTNKQSNICVDVKNSTETNVQSICENKLKTDSSNNSAQTASGTIASVPYALLQEAETYKHFLMQHTVHYGQWYCCLCECMFQSLTDMLCHSQEIHPDIGTQISNFREKSNESMNEGLISQELSNHEVAMKNMPQDYFCVPCQRSIPSLDHFHQHSIGKMHKHAIISNEKCINTNTAPEEPANKRQDVNNDKIDDKDISVNASNENDSIGSLPSNFRKEEKGAVSLKSCNENTITAIQLNNTKFDGTLWPQYTCTETAAEYTCDLCNKRVEENDIISHEIIVHQSGMMCSMRYIHDWLPAIKDFNVAIRYPLFRCSFCNEIIHGVLALSVHFVKHEHKENVESFINIKRRDYDSCKDVQINVEPLEFLNIIFFENNGGTLQVKEQPVMRIKNHCTTGYKNSIKKLICFACSYNVKNTRDVINHLCTTLEHLEHFKSISLTYNYLLDISISKEHSSNEAREIKFLTSREDISIDNGSLQKHNINETQINTEQCNNHNLLSTVNTNNKNDGLRQNKEKTSGFFTSFDIFTEINTSIKHINLPRAENNSVKKLSTEFNKTNNLNRYNKMYKSEFLDFEEIMFACNERKLKEMKQNLEFFVPHFDIMLCLVCNDPQLCNAQMIYEHINSEEHITQFVKLQKNKEHLELLKELMQPINVRYARCFACNKDVHGRSNNASNSLDYKYHTHFSSHKKAFLRIREQFLNQTERILEEFQNLWYNIQYFACVKCDMRFKQKISFLEHLDNVQHKRVLKNKDNSMFDFCLTCATLWYKNENCAKDFCTSYRKHCQKETHRYLQKSYGFAVTSLPQSLKKLLENVNKTAAILFESSDNVLKKDHKAIQLTNALKHIFKTHRLPVEVCMSGSRVTGLALPHSDIDIYVNFGDQCTEPKLIKSRSKQIRDCLRADNDNWDIMLTLDNSRTPLINVKHRLTGLQCDISFMNGLSVENSLFIKSFNMGYPPCRKLTLFLKKWLSMGHLTGSTGIKNYALVWLVIFYLQIKFKAPSIATLIKSHNWSKITSEWKTGVANTIPIDIPELPIHELLIGFFEYYESFNYARFVVCPLLGETCEKRTFAEVSTLPNSMEHYIAQLKNTKREFFRIDSSMCVQDPFDLSHNLTKAVPILTLKRFKQYCNASLSILRNVSLKEKKLNNIVL